MIYLTPEQILFLHARLIDETGGLHGVRDLNMLLSACGRPQATYNGQDLYPDIFLKAGALIDSLIRNHPFVDGNKRTGIATGGLFLSLNGLRFVAENSELFEFTVKVARSEHSLSEIAKWLRDHVRNIP